VAKVVADAETAEAIAMAVVAKAAEVAINFPTRHF
jgi:hypothetical protein